MSTFNMDILFERAARMLFPDLTTCDERLSKVADYAREIYYKNPAVHICVLCAIDGNTLMFKDFYQFCKGLGINPGRREVILSAGQLFYSEDYSKWPIDIKTV